MEIRNLDAYFSPPEILESLFEEENIPQNIWEPSCGNGQLSQALIEKYNRNVFSSDIENYGYINQNELKDFFEYDKAPNNSEAIITNPPFYCIKDYIQHAKKLVRYVYIFGKLTLLESHDRTPVLEDGTWKFVYPFRNRIPTMHRLGYTGKKNSSAIAFAWYVFDTQHDGSLAKIKRITCNFDKDKYK